MCWIGGMCIVHYMTCFMCCNAGHSLLCWVVVKSGPARGVITSFYFSALCLIPIPSFSCCRNAYVSTRLGDRRLHCCFLPAARSALMLSIFASWLGGTNEPVWPAYFSRSIDRIHVLMTHWVGYSRWRAVCSTGFSDGPIDCVPISWAT